jgi:hypothetical protein
LHHDGLPAGAPLPRQVFRGPMTRPSITVNPGPVHGFKLLLYPQALHALTGLEIDRLVDRYLPLDGLFDAEWRAMADAVQQAGDDDQRVRLIEAFLRPLWQAAGAAAGAVGGAAGGRVVDWAQALQQQAAAAAARPSARTLERSIRRHAGQPLRRLKRLARAEQSWALQDGDPAGRAPSAGWADFALAAGYADQAHLCREVRAITGLSPAELWSRARDAEPFWLYRVWSGGSGASDAAISAIDSSNASGSGDFGNAATPIAEQANR